MKINKGIPLIGVREDRCAVYFDNKHIKLNACARDALNDPDLVGVKFDKGTIKISAGKKPESDYKVTKIKGTRCFSGHYFLNVVSHIPKSTKLYGEMKGNELHIKIPDEFLLW